jgi:hypothetical protein
MRGADSLFAVPENWEEMTEEEQDAWVKVVLMAMQKQPAS